MEPESVRHRLTGIGKIEGSHDGRFAILDLMTDNAPLFRLEVETARLDELIGQFLAIAQHAGEAQGVDPTPQVGSPVQAVPIPTNGIGAMLGPQAQTLIVFRVGCIDLTVQVPSSQTKLLGQRLVQLGHMLEAEPPRMQ